MQAVQKSISLTSEIATNGNCVGSADFSVSSDNKTMATMSVNYDIKLDKQVNELMLPVGKYSLSASSSGVKVAEITLDITEKTRLKDYEWTLTGSKFLSLLAPDVSKNATISLNGKVTIEKLATIDISDVDSLKVKDLKDLSALTEEYQNAVDDLSGIFYQ